MVDPDKVKRLKEWGDYRMREDVLKKYNEGLPEEKKFKEISSYFSSDKEFINEYCRWVSPITNVAYETNSEQDTPPKIETRPKAVFILQDWASTESLKGLDLEEIKAIVKRGHYKGKFRAKERLQSLIKEFFRLDFNQVYVTNLFPYIKPGDKRTHIKPKCLDMALEDFCLPQIRILREDNQNMVVVCLSLSVYNTFRRRFGKECKKNMPDLAKSVESFPADVHDPKKSSSEEFVNIYCQYHPSYPRKHSVNWGTMMKVIKS